MKKLLFALALLMGFFASAQNFPPPYYTPVNTTGYVYGRAMAFPGGITLPAFGDTALVTGQSRTAGAVLIDTAGSNKGLYIWYDMKWNQVTASGGGGSYTAGFGMTLIGSDFSVDTTGITSRIRMYQQRDSLLAVLFKISDTATRFAGYTRVTRFLDTATNIQARIQAKQDLLVSGTTIKTVNGNSLLGSGNLTVAGAAPDEANVIDYFADSTNSRGSALAFQNAIATKKDIYVPKGTYKIDTSLVLNPGQKIRGAGTLKTTLAGGTTYATQYSIIQATKGSTIDGLTFSGTTGKGSGFGTTYSPQNGIQIVGDSVNIRNCRFMSLTGSGVLGMYFNGSSFQPNTFGQISNCFFDNCTAGVYNYLGGDYQTLSHSVIVNCFYGVLQNTANAKVIGCTLDYNNIGFLGSYNSDRGVIANTSLNHNSDALQFTAGAVQNGYMITGCTFYYGHITVTDGERVVFTNCSFGVNGNITVNGTASPNRVSFFNSYVTPGLPTNWITAGTGVIVKPGLLGNGISRSLDSVYRKPGQDSLFFKLGEIELAVRDSVGTGGGGGATALSSITAATGANQIFNIGKQRWDWPSSAGDTALVIGSTSTLANGSANVGLGVVLKGASVNNFQTTQAVAVSNTKTGVGSTNIGLAANASGADNNFAISVGTGSIQIGTAIGGRPLNIQPPSNQSAGALISFNSSSQASWTYTTIGVQSWSAGLTPANKWAIQNVADLASGNLLSVDNNGKVAIGNINALSFFDNSGSTRLRDSLLLTYRGFVSASTADSVLVIGSDNLVRKRAQSDIAAGSTGVTSVATNTGTGITGGTITGTGTLALDTTSTVVTKTFLSTRGYLSAVTGTTNRITSSGGLTPVIDISASYSGQSSITTHGTITSGGLGTGAVIGGVTMTLGSDAANDIYYRNGSGVLTRLANGVTGNYLAANTGAAPSWQTPAGGGGGTDNFNNSAIGFPLVKHSTQAIKPLSATGPIVLDSTSNTGNITVSIPAATTGVDGYVSTANGQILPGLKLFGNGLGATGTLGSTPATPGLYLQYNSGAYLDAVTPSTTSWQQLNIRASLITSYISGTAKTTVNANGLYIGGSTLPTAKLMLAAETATASSEPIRFTVPAALASTPVSQAFGPSTTGDDLMFVIATGAARKIVTLNDVALTSGRVPFNTTNGRLTDASSFTFASGALSVGVSGTLGTINLLGNTSGTISIKPQAAAGTYNFNLPTTAGTSGYLLTSAGGVGSPMTWTDPATLGGSGAVTSVTGHALKLSSGVLTTNTAYQALTFGATTTMNPALGINATETLTGNTTLSVTSPEPGMTYVIKVKQNATGGWTFADPSSANVPLDPAPNAVTLVALNWDGTTWLTSGYSPPIAEGTYVPTVTNGANVASSTAGVCFYSRAGSTVTVTYVLSLASTANATNTTFALSLPIASNFTAGSDATGLVAQEATGKTGVFAADATNDRVTTTFVTGTTAGNFISGEFKYTIK